MADKDPGSTSREALTAYLIAKAMKDEAFREALLRDPRAAIARELGAELPPEITIHVHEETPTTFHLVLPSVPRLQVRSHTSRLPEQSGVCWWSTNPPPETKYPTCPDTCPGTSSCPADNCRLA